MNLGERAQRILDATPGVVTDEAFEWLGIGNIIAVVNHYRLPVERVRGLGYRLVRG